MQPWRSAHLSINFSGPDFLLSSTGKLRSEDPRSIRASNDKPLEKMPPFSLAWFGMVWHGLAWLGMAWHGLAWLGMAWGTWLSEDPLEIRRRTVGLVGPVTNVHQTRDLSLRVGTKPNCSAAQRSKSMIIMTMMTTTTTMMMMMEMEDRTVR